LGCYKTDNFVWLEKDDLYKIQKDGNEITLKFKPLDFRYLLALIKWLVECSLSFAWTFLEFEDFADLRSHSLPGILLSYQPLVLLHIALLLTALVLVR
jgi:hypothetical protein